MHLHPDIARARAVSGQRAMLLSKQEPGPQQFDVSRQDKGKVSQHTGGKARQRSKENIKKLEVFRQGNKERRRAKGKAGGQQQKG